MLDAALREKLDALCRRQQRLRALHAFVRALLFGTLAYALIRIALLFTTGTVPAVPLWTATIALGLFGTLTRRTPAFTRLDAARYVDQKLALRERVGTAVEYSGAEAPQSPVVARLHQDAAVHGAAIDPEQLIPLKPPRELLWLIPALAIALLAALPQKPPPLPWLGPHSTQAPQRVATEEIDALRQLAKRLQNDASAQGAQELQRLVQGLESLADRAEQGLVGPDAFRDELARLEDQLNAALGSEAPGGAPATPLAGAASDDWSPGAPGDEEPGGSALPPERQAADEEGEPAPAGEGSEEGDEADPHGTGEVDEAIPDESGESQGQDAESEGDSETPLPNDVPGPGEHDPFDDDAPWPPDAGDPGGGEPGSEAGDDAREPADSEPSTQGERLDLSGDWRDGTPFVVPHAGLGTGGERERLPFAGGFDTEPTPGDEVGVGREEIPPAYRHWVQRYFDQLAPDE